MAWTSRTFVTSAQLSEYEAQVDDYLGTASDWSTKIAAAKLLMYNWIENQNRYPDRVPSSAEAQLKNLAAYWTLELIFRDFERGEESYFYEKWKRYEGLRNDEQKYLLSHGYDYDADDSGTVTTGESDLAPDYGIRITHG